MEIAIDAIRIPDRQRKDLRLTTDFITSVNKRLINPIILGRSDTETFLVAGERRLRALIEGGHTTLTENTHFRFFDDLDPIEARIIELEENVKREDLTWREHAAAVGQIHDLFSSLNENWTIAKTSQRINIFPTYAGRLLTIYRNLSNPALRDATTTDQAISILQNIAERRTAAIVGDLTRAATSIFDTEERPNETPSDSPSDPTDIPANSLRSPIPNPSNGDQPPPTPNPVSSSALPSPIPSRDSPRVIHNEDFLKFAATYSGPKFTVVHCDFPYDIRYDSYAASVTSSDADYDFTGFWPLLDALLANADRLFSYSSHLIFWFSMKFYEKTRILLTEGGFYVHEHPLVWFKSDNSGIIPGRGSLFPRRVYETAFLASRGRRPLIKSLANCYAAPMASNPIHPSQKPEPVLRHFLGLVVDETTDFLDPTCGSGSSVRAAEDLNARSVLGLELNAAYVDAAEAQTHKARLLRQASKRAAE